MVWIITHHKQSGYDFFDDSNKEIRAMRLSEEMPGCIDSIRKEYRVDQIVGHSFQLLCVVISTGGWLFAGKSFEQSMKLKNILFVLFCFHFFLVFLFFRWLKPHVNVNHLRLWALQFNTGHDSTQNSSILRDYLHQKHLISEISIRLF